MTIDQAFAIRMKWKQRAHRSPCGHLTLELEWNDQGVSTGHYICILCGQSVAQRLSATPLKVRTPSQTKADKKVRPAPH